jgi:hypothetical protein
MTRVMVAMLVAGCATARTPVRYREDTHTLLETRSTKLTACYTKALASNALLAGRITIHFVVERRTGNVMRVVVDPEMSRAPEALVLCVRDAVDGLRLDPPDRNEGRATFEYRFQPLPAGT